jgi:hypothetical protein
MERINPKPEKAEILRGDQLKDLERALYNIDEGKTLILGSDGVQTITYMPTGETTVHRMKAGQTEYEFKVPAKAPVISESFDNLEDFIARSKVELEEIEEKRKTSPNYSQSAEIDDPEFKEWLGMLAPFLEAKIMQAARRLAEKPPEENEKTICANCRGEAEFDRDCDCKQGGKVTFDIETGEKDSEREEGEPDPFCEECEGTGNRSITCSCCMGTGYMQLYPKVHIINEHTGDYQTLHINIAELVASGQVELKNRLIQSQFQDGFIYAEYQIGIKLQDYFKEKVAELGLDPENSMLSRGRHNMDLGWELQDEPLCNFYWRKNDGKVEQSWRYYGHSAETEEFNSEKALLGTQRTIARHFAWPGILIQDLKKDPEATRKEALNEYGKVLNKDNVVEEVAIPIKEVKPLLSQFNALIGGAEAMGYKIGFANSFIATGETGPSFYLMDNAGNAITQLSNDYSLRESVTNARSRLIEVFASEVSVAMRKNLINKLGGILKTILNHKA